MEKTLEKTDLDGILSPLDIEKIENIHSLYTESKDSALATGSVKEYLSGFHQVYCSFGSAREERLLLKLRDVKTSDENFRSYIERSYQILFHKAFIEGCRYSRKEKIRTPVDNPFPSYSSLTIPDIQSEMRNTTICALLRAALLPSFVISKECEDYTGIVPPFAFFKIRRDDERHENDMRYILDTEKSYFSKEDLNDRTLIFPDPMNATGGSVITVINYLSSLNIKPRKVIILNVIAALTGVLRVVRKIDNVSLYSLAIDPVLNDRAYIVPGLGDAGDRINGKDEGRVREVLELLEPYGKERNEIYKAQISEMNRLLNAKK